MTAIFLSHVLGAATPGFGGKPGFELKSARCIAHGDSSNSAVWTFSNHLGTHVDAPFHFFDSGQTIERYAAEEWIFSRPVLVDRAALPGELIGPVGIEELIPVDADLVLLRTGFERHRADALYWENNPGLTPEFGTWLRTHRPAVRAIGFDFLSLTAFQHRAVGRTAHKSFLDPAPASRSILIIEDMSLAGLPATPKTVLVAPLRVNGADGSPVTVFAYL